MLIISNAFSINMLTETASYSFRKVTAEKAAETLSRDFVSAVGHADTAAIFSDILQIEIPCNRMTLELTPKDVLVVGQYKGPRLPEGCHILPEGSSIEWWLVLPINWQEIQDYYEGRS